MAAGLLAATVVRAQDLPGTSAIASPAIDQWSIFGTGESHRMMVDQTGPGGYAFVVKTAAAGQIPWDVQAAVATAQPIHSGDVILLAFWARALATPPGQPAISVIADVQQNHAPYTRHRRPILKRRHDVEALLRLRRIDAGPDTGRAAANRPTGDRRAGNRTRAGLRAQFRSGYDLGKLPVN
ncbi:MAG: hypothetical protein WDN06_13320 [Asticcacaulis sp.]